MSLIWECGGCFKRVVDGPHGHTDYGGEIVISGPRCQECDEKMDHVSADEVARCKRCDGVGVLHGYHGEWTPAGFHDPIPCHHCGGTGLVYPDTQREEGP